MRVVSLIEHLTRGNRDEPHWDTLCIVKAIKGEPYRGSAVIAIDGHERVLNQARQDIALDWAAQHLAPRILRRHTGKVALVPIPGHRCTDVMMVGRHRVASLADRVVQRMRELSDDCEPTVLPLLYWRRGGVTSAHKGGGTRKAWEVYEDYRVMPTYRIHAARRAAILFDDVVTSGARLYAAERLLGGLGFTVSDFAYAVARTVHEPGEAFQAIVKRYDVWRDEPPREEER